MFGTLRYVTYNKDGEFLEHEMRAIDGSTSRLQHTACDNCRVRCNGRRSGCYRCTALGASCTYSGPAPRKRQRKRSHLGYEFNGGSSEDDTVLKEPFGENVEPNNLPKTPRSSDHPPANHNDPPVDDHPVDHLTDHAKLGPLALIDKNIDPQLTRLDGDGGDGGDCNTDNQMFFNSFDWHLGDEAQPSSASPQIQPQLQPKQNNNPPSTPTDVNTIAQPKSGVLQRRDMINTPLSMPGPAGSVDDRIDIDTMLRASPFLSPPASAQSQRQRHLLPSSGQSEQGAVHDTCGCLPTAVFLLDELEGSHAYSHQKQLDSHLSSYREVLAQCKNMLQCLQCRNRPENMTVLNLVLERQVNMSDSMVDAYLALTADDYSAVAPRSSAKSSQGGSRASPERPEMLLGEYEITTTSEWQTMVRVLIFTQMSALDHLLAQMKHIPSLAQRDSQMVRLLTSEQRNSRIARKLWSGLPESTSLSDLGLLLQHQSPRPVTLNSHNNKNNNHHHHHHHYRNPQLDALEQSFCSLSNSPRE
ncbi:hypothetical protein FQN54_006426 [Arachnomyces sp. PD_36]|nr:hypothetical protein FQN54_006426 [Arachnomyces sp. PD_36]